MMMCFHGRRPTVRGIASVLLMVCSMGLAVEPAYLSPIDLVADSAGTCIYIAEAGGQRIAVLDTSSGRIKDHAALGLRPSGLCLSPDDSRLFVTAGEAEGKVLIIDTATGQVVHRITVGHSPSSPVVSADGKTLYICNRFNDNVSVIDLTTGRIVAVIAVVREPDAAALTLDGSDLYVLNLLPRNRADQEYTAAVVSVVSTKTREVVATVTLPNGSNQLRGVCMSPDGKYAYVTHILARYQLPTSQLTRGWINTNALSVIEIASRKLVNTVLLDDVDSGAANPWGVACAGNGKWLCVTHAGTDEISVIDREQLHQRLDEASANQKVTSVVSGAEDVSYDLSFMTGLRRRVHLSGKGPRNLVVIGSTVYAAAYFSDTLSAVNTATGGPLNAQVLSLGPNSVRSTARRGEMLFNDASLCFQGWQSCASCHTDQGRVDALNWDLLNDGIGNPKNTRSLLLAHETPPAMSLGVRPDAESAVRAGIQHIQFAVRPEEEAVAIDRYLQALRPVPSPYLVEGRLSQSAVRGQAVFHAAGCASCHTPGLYTNKKAYDVGTGRYLDEGRAFDTPSLIEVWRTAPYLSDGRAETVADVLRTHNHDDRHGHTSGLTEEQLEDLVAFVLSL